MRTFLLKYTVEFFVLITGLLITFYIEDQNELNYKIELKNQSLIRLIRNIENDISDQRTNILKVDKTISYYNIIAERGDELFETDKDSLGYYLTAISRSSTIFLSNVEEYLTLRNSGASTGPSAPFVSLNLPRNRLRKPRPRPSMRSCWRK